MDGCRDGFRSFVSRPPCGRPEVNCRRALMSHTSRSTTAIRELSGDVHRMGEILARVDVDLGAVPDTVSVEERLERPPHLDDDRWQAIREHEDRLLTAVDNGDKPLIIGSAKELIESVARAVIESKNVVVPSNAEFDPTVNAAHKALDRLVGEGLDTSEQVRTVAASARKIAFQVRAIRNDHGTGHGRATVTEIDDELATVTVDACCLWCRWALKRLGHALADEPQRLIETLQTDTFTRRGLQQQFTAIRMPLQPPDVQRAVGAAFAQRALTGTFVAHDVGVEAAVYETSLGSFPVPYREGVAEGLVFDRSGFLHLTSSGLPDLVGVLQPIPPSALDPFLQELAAKVREAGMAAQRLVTDLDELAKQAAAQAVRFEAPARPAWNGFAESLRRSDDA